VPLRTSPVVTATAVYQFVDNQGIVALDKTTGEFNRKARWAAAGTSQFLAEDDKYAYLLRQRDRRIVAIDRATGKEQFHSQRTDFVAFAINANAPAAPTTAPTTGPSRVGGGVIFAATRKGQVYAIRPVLTAGSVGEVVLDFKPADSVARSE
jgi:outer membrane protein assembly factor BamB